MFLFLVFIWRAERSFMIVSDKELVKKSKRGAFPDIKCLYGTIPRDMRMHMHRVSQYAQVLFEAAYEEGIWDDTLPENIFDFSEEIFRLHDIGRHYIPVGIYNKVDALTDEEKSEIRNHTIYALQAEQSVFLPFFPEEIMPYFRDVAVMHHERFDGTGYPYNKAGEEIPFMARVCAIADAYDGMVSWKTYKESLTMKQAFEILRKEAGRQFQSELVECFIKCEKEIEEIDRMVNGKI